MWSGVYKLLPLLYLVIIPVDLVSKTKEEGPLITRTFRVIYFFVRSLKLYSWKQNFPNFRATLLIVQYRRKVRAPYAGAYFRNKNVSPSLSSSPFFLFLVFEIHWCPCLYKSAKIIENYDKLFILYTWNIEEIRENSVHIKLERVFIFLSYRSFQNFPFFIYFSFISWCVSGFYRGNCHVRLSDLRWTLHAFVTMLSFFVVVFFFFTRRKFSIDLINLSEILDTVSRWRIVRFLVKMYEHICVEWWRLRWISCLTKLVL